MRRIGRYQLRVRTLLLVPALIALSWWLAIQAVEWRYLGDDYQRMAALQEAEELACLRTAGTAIPHHYGEVLAYVHTADRKCSYPVMRSRPLTEVERTEQARVRDQARRRAAYHRALKRRYQWLAWFPWFGHPKEAPPPL